MDRGAWQAIYSPWGHTELDTTERLHVHFSLSCAGEGNGKPLQCSCLKNPRDWEAWCAAIYGVAQSRTRLKQLSSSSMMKVKEESEKLAYSSTFRKLRSWHPVPSLHGK